jgi:hypothetical protein
LRRKLVIAMSMLTLLTICTPLSAAGWRVDEPLRFQLAYIPDGRAGSAGAARVPSLGLSPDFLPDIDNINLAEIQKLGFTLPGREGAERYKLYLKLFAFPAGLDAGPLCEGILRAHHISDLPGGGPELVRFMSDRGNVAVKFGHIDGAGRVFSEASPFPPFTAGGGSAFASTLARYTPFYSLYVTPDRPAQPGSDDELARRSAGGVVAFHRELLAHYRKTLQEVSGPGTDRYHFFRDDRQKITLRVPRSPLVFDNWRNLPMPTDRKRHFLSGLLLIYRSQDGDVGLPAETVFEVASVVRLP